MIISDIFQTANHTPRDMFIEVSVFLGPESLVGSVLGSPSCLMQCRGFDTPGENFSGRGDFSLGVNMGSDSIPSKLLQIRV